jgi:hypothetical protein
VLGVGVGVAPEVILQSNTAVKSKVLQESVFVGVGVGHNVFNMFHLNRDKQYNYLLDQTIDIHHYTR